MTAAAAAVERKREVQRWLNADELFTRVKAAYPAPRFAVFGEVRNAGGFGASRSADAVVVALWPSDWHRITIIEIKQSRSDWLRELKNPAKGNEMAALGDGLFVVANRCDVKVEEVPPAWGLMVPVRSGLVCLKPATFTEARPVARGFLSSMLKRSLTASLAAVEAKTITDRVRAETEEAVTKRLGNSEQRWTELRDTVRKYEEASGVRIEYSGDASNIGAAVRAVLSGNGEVSRYLARLETIGRVAAELQREISVQIDKARAGIAVEATT